MKAKKDLLLSIITKNTLIIIFFLIAYPAFCQSKYPSPSQTFEASKLIRAVENHPDNIKFHEAFIKSLGSNDPKLIKQYGLWMKKFPKCAMVPFAVGKALLNADLRAKDYLLKAVTIDPKMAEAWGLLAHDLLSEGNKQKRLEYLKKATIADPRNGAYLFFYADFFKDADPAKYVSLMLNVASRFKGTEWGATALYSLAKYPYNHDKRVAYYNQLYAIYYNKKYNGFLMGMDDYFDYLINTSPDNAEKLALKMELVVKTNKDIWKHKTKVAQYFITARKLIEANNTAGAVEAINKIDLGNYRTFVDAKETLMLFKAEIADANKQTKQAYDSLALFYSKQPSDRVFVNLLSYGKKLGLDSAKVYADIWKLRDASAMPETKFTNESFPDKKQVSLSDFKGKVVLLTFWFPSCGPCREEFPHFENVLRKFNRNQIAYLAINAQNIQEDYVLPVIKSNGYTFIPLRDNAFSKTGNLPRNIGVPQNFLIDQKGRVIFSDFRIGDDNERTLELMIRETLQRHAS